MKPENLDDWESIEGFAAEFYRRVSAERAAAPQSMERKHPLVRTSMVTFQTRPFKPIDPAAPPALQLGCACPDPTFQSRWRGKVKGKCGWPGYMEANKRYLKRTISGEHVGTGDDSSISLQVGTGRLRADSSRIVTASYAYSYDQRFDPNSCEIVCENLQGTSEYTLTDTATTYLYFDADPAVVTNERLVVAVTTCNGSPTSVHVCTQGSRQYAGLLWNVTRQYNYNCDVSNPGDFPITGDRDCLCDSKFSDSDTNTQQLSGPCSWLTQALNLVDTINSDTELVRTDEYSNSDSSSGTDNDDCVGHINGTALTSDTSELTITETLSDEFTDALLKSLTISELPPWENTEDEWTDGPASSSAHLSSNGLINAVTEGEIRPVHEGPCYRKIWMRAVITPDDGSAVSYEEIGVYEYTAAEDGEHIGPIYTVPIPDENATTTVQAKWICREGDDEPEWPE